MPDPPPESLTRELIEQDRFVRDLARGLLACGWLTSEDQVDDVVQGTWLAALEKPPRRREALRAWLASVARNLALKMRRTESRRRRREEISARPEALPSARELVEQFETRRALVEAVAALDERDRLLVILRFQEGLTSEQIGERLGLNSSTVRTRLQRTLEKLRHRVAGHDPGSDWRALLLPLALPRNEAAAAAVSSATLATVGTPVGIGALIMTKMKVGLTACALAALLVTLAVILRDEAPLESGQVFEASSDLAELDASPGPVSEARARRLPAPDRDPAATETSTTASFGPGRVSGRVLDPRSNPIAGARVGYWKRDYGADSGLAPLAQTRSEADGSFVLEGLPVGPFYGSIAAEHASFNSGRTRAVTLTDVESESYGLELRLYDAAELGGVVRNVAGEPLAGAWVMASGYGSRRLYDRSNRDGRFHFPSTTIGSATIRAFAEGYGLVQLPSIVPPRDDLEIILPESPSARLEVTTVDEEGKPLAGAHVRLSIFLGFWRFNLPAELGQRRTNEEGLAVFEGLPPAGYRCHVELDGTPLSDVDPPEENRFPLVTGQVTHRRFTFPKPFHVSGRVTTRQGDPLADRRITVRALFSGNSFFYRSTVTRANGQFKLEAPAERSLQIQIDDEDWLLEGAGDEWLLLEREEAGTLDLVAVKAAKVHGQVLSADGAPVAAEVVRLHAYGDNWSSRLGTDLTDDRGLFEIGPLQPQPAGRTLRVSSVRGVGRVDDLPALNEGEVLRDLVIHLEPAARIAGTVRSEDGHPVSGAVVELEEVDGTWGDPVQNKDRVEEQALTDRYGNYVIEPLPAGHYEITARSRGAESPEPEEPVALRKGETREVDIVLEELATISGRVIDSNGDPVADCDVVAWWPRFEGPEIGADEARVRSQGDGSFVLRGLADGTYRVTAETRWDIMHDNHEPWMATLESEPQMVPAGQLDVVLIFDRRGAGSVVGRLIFPPWLKTGETRIGIRLRLEPRQDPNLPHGASSSLVPDGQGRFRLDHVTPADYTLTIESDVFETITREITVTADRISDLGDLKVATGRAVSGRVVDSSGVPLAGVKIELEGGGWGTSDPRYSDVADVITDVDGRFETTVVGTDSGLSIAAHRDGLAMLETFLKPEAVTRPIELVLQPGGTIRLEGLPTSREQGRFWILRIAYADDEKERGDYEQHPDLTQEGHRVFEDSTRVLLGLPPDTYRIDLWHDPESVLWHGPPEDDPNAIWVKRIVELEAGEVVTVDLSVNGDR